MSSPSFDLPNPEGYHGPPTATLEETFDLIQHGPQALLKFVETGILPQNTVVEEGARSGASKHVGKISYTVSGENDINTNQITYAVDREFASKIEEDLRAAERTDTLQTEWQDKRVVIVNESPEGSLSAAQVTNIFTGNNFGERVASYLRGETKTANPAPSPLNALAEIYVVYSPDVQGLMEALDYVIKKSPSLFDNLRTAKEDPAKAGYIPPDQSLLIDIDVSIILKKVLEAKTELGIELDLAAICR